MRPPASSAALSLVRLHHLHLVEHPSPTSSHPAACWIRFGSRLGPVGDRRRWHRPAGKNQENERRPPGERYAHINAGHVPDFIRFGVKPHCYDELKCYTPSTRPRYKYKLTSTVYRCSARVCVQCAGVPAPRLPLSTPQGPSTAAVGRGRGRRVPLRAAAARPIRQRPGCRRSPPCLRSRRPICMHCSVTIERNCIKQLPAAATRFSWSLDMRGGISPSWLEVLLCAAAVPPMPQVAPTDRKLRHGHARLLERACLTSACELSAASQQSPVHPTSSRRRLSYSSHISGSR